ncbi:esterase B1-like [Cylas formicarius]|uniref:esterase B1-like n=1 Tax=Cylas formicarius TaxID=197179 RepID=UPI0029588FDE|nr:esterase B1-like [Cylas formicarius]
MSSPVVKLLQGTVQGALKEDIYGGKYHSFLGIPYAKPPVGELRFKDPLPPDSWLGVRDCTAEANISLQRNLDNGNITGSEDCLYLNVFTKDLPNEQSDRLKPVMVWIHGGAFKSGSNSLLVFGPEFLITEDIVLVSINYRLGLLGFLRLKDSDFNVYGNMGLKDQTEALRWVKNNIRSFNGDPNNVTIFGESAGGASVHYHVLSPLSRDLFHKAIIQSGTALNNFSEFDHSSVQIAKTIDSDVRDELDAWRFFKHATAEQLIQAEEIYIKKTPAGKFIGPVIEKPHKKAFITRRAIDIIASEEYNKVPLIFGYTDQEGLVFKAQIFGSIANREKPFSMEDVFPRNGNKLSDNVKTLVKKLENFYLKQNDPEAGRIMLDTDWTFLSGTWASVKNHVQTSPYPVYLYKMTVVTKLNFFKILAHLEQYPGVCHGDDIGYLFKTFTTPPIEPGSPEEVGLRRFVKLWTNFATHGNPTPDHDELGITWKPVMIRQMNVLNIGEELKIEINSESKRLALWREIYHQHPSTVKYL